MPCLCGDTNCPSCGPAQGYDPAFETVCGWMYEVLLADLPEAINREWLAEDLASRLGRCGDADLVDAVYAAAAKWERGA